MIHSVSLTILLATYNGAQHLPAQLDSLLAQTCADWRLMARDDCSTDATPAILADYQARFPDRISIVPGDGRNLGPCGNFAALMAAAASDYFMFCDQDDVWLPEKIERTLAAMRELEGSHGSGKPLLVHTDLAVTDERLTVVEPSLWRYQHTDPAHSTRLNRLLVQNYATGCTMLFNRAARDLALPIPTAAMMHDWWLALVTAAFGQVGFVDTPLVLYRQHGLNDIGAQGFTPADVVRRFTRFGEARAIIRQVLAQGAAFHDRYREQLSPAQREMLSVYARLGECNGLLRRWYLLKYRFFYTGLLRNLGRLVIG